MPNATITVSTDWDTAFIAEQAGSSEMPMLVGDQLTIYGVEQAAADAALAAYDHEARMTVVKWEQVRAERTRQLFESDWTEVSKIANPGKQLWLDRRQELKDIPATYAGDPDGALAALAVFATTPPVYNK
jgi:hypothetical protein